MTGMKKTLITSDRPPNGSTLSTTMVRGSLVASVFRSSPLADLSLPEHYLDREAESNDPSFLSQSLSTLWSHP